ncbi:MAG: VOC family protein [Planctomycetales bacterium]|nr:VOC family protein [Planctomycetales bacterium]
MSQNAIHWFEITALDLNRAVRFYNQVLGINIESMDFMGCQMAMFPCGNGGVSGALIKHENLKPGTDGTCVYFDGGDDLAGPLGRVEAAGGTVILPKMAIGEHGFCAQFIDSEGNRVGLHSMK